jgi:hypothetical protein
MPKYIYISDDVLRSWEGAEVLRKKMRRWAETQAAEAQKESANDQRMRDRVRMADANLKLNRQVRARKKAEKLEIIRGEVMAYRLRRPHSSALEITNVRGLQINEALQAAEFKPYKPATIAAMIRRKIDRGDD